jgi:hypothetical protein
VRAWSTRTVRPPLEEAAREIMNFLRDIGVLAQPKATEPVQIQQNDASACRSSERPP